VTAPTNHPAYWAASIVLTNPVARERFSGRTLVERHVEILARLGVADVRLEDGGHVAQGQRAASARRLVVVAERVIDPRIYARVLAEAGPTVVTDNGAPIGIETVDNDRAQQSLAIDDIEPYSRELRRSLRPYWIEVSSTADRPRVARVLTEASGKGHQDLPARFINAPIEKAIARRLADTSITANQLTAACNVAAYVVAALLARGSFLAAAVGAMIVGVLDGLDGRQARIQMKTSPFGRIEHLLDKIYEVLWMFAFAFGLSAGFAVSGFAAPLLAWSAAYALDSAAYDTVKRRHGVQLDEATKLDAAIRLVAGRRNVYACIMLVGAVTGRPAVAFHTIVWWAAATAFVHIVRALQLRSTTNLLVHPGSSPRG
jgi:phosphatidylglycerophosphate synthase